jgi:hypothetical protein
MAHQLTVVTHTRGDRPELLRQCCASVEAQLPPDAQHKVLKLNTKGTFSALMRARLDALTLGDIVAFVDDDDYLLEGSLQLAYRAIIETNAGLSFTGERLVDALGKPLYDSDIRGPKFASMIACHPGVAHHLCLIRTSCVSLDCWTRFNDYGPALEWMLRGSAALSPLGAVFVPKLGYCWRQHPESLSKSSAWAEKYDPNLFALVSKELMSRVTVDKRIPNYV